MKKSRTNRQVIAGNCLQTSSVRSTADKQTNIKLTVKVKGVCELKWYTNTCYINAMLQCMLSTVELVRYFERNYNRLQEGNLAKEFADLVKEMKGDEKIIDQDSFIKSIIREHQNKKELKVADQFLINLRNSLGNEAKNLFKCIVEDSYVFKENSRNPRPRRQNLVYSLA